MGTRPNSALQQEDAFELTVRELADNKVPDIEKLEEYWTRRANSYSEQIKRNEREGPWPRELMSYFPSETIRVLDMGTGAGFFAILLARLGFSITAADYSPDMLDRAEANAGDLRNSIT